MKQIAALTPFLCLFAFETCSGADFKNLGFDEADISNLRDHSGDPAKVLPGWNLYLGRERQRFVYVNPLLPPPEDIYAELGDYQHFTAEGKYVLHFIRLDRNGPVWSLEQTGTIPPKTKFLTYRSAGFAMEVQINDEMIPPLDWQLPPFDWQVPKALYHPVYDVSAFAGQEVKLAFVGPFGPETIFGFGGTGTIDSIMFLADVPKITAVVQSAPDTKTNEVTLHFTPIAGRDMIVEYRDNLSRDGVWTALPISPSTLGTIVDHSPAEHRFYRLRISVRQEPLP